MKFKPLARWKELRAGRHDPEIRRALLRTYWVVCIVLLFVMGIGGVSYGAWQFMQPLEKKVESDAVIVARRVSLNRADLQAILDGFDRRTQLFEEKRQMPSLKDPSQ